MYSMPNRNTPRLQAFRSTRTLRIYSEMLPYDALVRPRTLELLRRYGLDVVLAVRPWQLEPLGRVVRTLADAGVSLSIWPMLADEEGRWANGANASSFARFLGALLKTFDAGPCAPCEILFDLEPALAHARVLAAVAGPLAPRAALSLSASLFRVAERSCWGTWARADDGCAELRSAVTEVHARGMGTAAAVWPLVALDPPGQALWQSLLGTPVDSLLTRRVSVMLYTTIFEGWSRRALRRRDASALLRAGCDRVVERWNGRAGVSLGCVGAGALGDEPVYRTPKELAEDVAQARAAGIEDLSLFDLAGVLSRESPEAWLDAFAFGVEVLSVPTSRRVNAARRFARMATWTLGKALTWQR